mmetsp:Transcript_94869/g.142122  ORF Transcript_94869/g.142122 Transcript_94869/m.142122 type:complete len:254 (-) Transcript_94869:31-792(-)
MSMSEDQVLTHYKRVSDSYYKVAYKPELQFNQKKILDKVKGLPPTTKVLDIGGGTGRDALLIHDLLSLQSPVVCVDLSEEMLSQITQKNKVTPVHDSATHFLETTTQKFDVMLMHEVLHHIPAVEIPRLFRMVYEKLNNGGSLIISARPQVDIDYPFTEEMKEIWKNDQQSQEFYENALVEGGLHISSEIIRFPISIPMDSWLKFVENRSWSTFCEANFSDQELQAQLEKLRKLFGSGMVTFEERLWFIEGKR